MVHGLRQRYHRFRSEWTVLEPIRTSLAFDGLPDHGNGGVALLQPTDLHPVRVAQVATYAGGTVRSGECLDGGGIFEFTIPPEPPFALASHRTSMVESPMVERRAWIAAETLIGYCGDGVRRGRSLVTPGAAWCLLFAILGAGR